MSPPESTPTHLLWAALCQSRPEHYTRVDFIPQPGTLDLASGIFKDHVAEDRVLCVNQVARVEGRATAKRLLP